MNKISARNIHKGSCFKIPFPTWFRYHARVNNWKEGRDYNKTLVKGKRGYVIEYLVNSKVARYLEKITALKVPKPKPKETYIRPRAIDKRHYDCKHYMQCLNDLAFTNRFKMGCPSCTRYQKQEAHACADSVGMIVRETCQL